MKIAIIGSRGLVIEDMERYISDCYAEIVSGGARGVDHAAAAFARRKGIKLTEFLPNYKEYGRRAPLIRNKQIVDYADALIAFWDGRSRGTLFTLKYCKEKKKPQFVFLCEENLPPRPYYLNI